MAYSRPIYVKAVIPWLTPDAHFSMNHSHLQTSQEDNPQEENNSDSGGQRNSSEEFKWPSEKQEPPWQESTSHCYQ